MTVTEAIAGTRLSTEHDFPNLEVWRHDEAKGPVYRIAFQNLEFSGGRFLLRVLATIVVALVIPLSIWAGVLAQWSGLHWLIGIGLFGAVVWLACHAGVRPGRIARVVELDFGNDRLRVLRNGRTEIERPRSRLQNITVQDHPDAEFARAARAEKGEKTLKDVEKQHCLIGWFGAGGGDQVILLRRAEWPSRHSLFEIRQAMLWTIAQAEGRETAEPEKRPSLNPPLD